MNNAIAELKKFIKHRKSMISTFRDKNQPWHKDNQDLPSEMADGLAHFLSDEVLYLEKVIQSLEIKTSTKCRHPKKDHDKCGETWYCMNCNEDLEK